MKNDPGQKPAQTILKLEDLAHLADYSLLDTLNCDPDAKPDGDDHKAREVFSGHYVTVTPTPVANPVYVAHSTTFFEELGFANQLATSEAFTRVFSGDLSQAPEPMRKTGWACGYALSIFGTEYYHQCPFKTGNGYGDGRAISVLEAVINGRRWEMQLKGGGPTPYCRGADGRAVLRSSVREFLAQEYMHALGVPTSRSLSLFVSKTETVRRPWYSEGSVSVDPDRIIEEPVAISTRVAPSFIRVGQIELFGRRARKQEHPGAKQELEQIILHVIDREYAGLIDDSLAISEKIVLLAAEFRSRLTSLVTNWIRVGYCQGNFNSDNCAVGGFTLDYGPFGFCDVFDPYYQPWTGGGEHFSFWNQPVAAERNFEMFCLAMQPLLESNPEAQQQLDTIKNGFAEMMQSKIEHMFAEKLGLDVLNPALFRELTTLMMQTPVDYTLFFRELSSLPDDFSALMSSFYTTLDNNATTQWCKWFTKWKSLVNHSSEQMKRVNPRYSLREWLLVPAYQQAATGNYTLIKELQDVMTKPYEEQSAQIDAKYYRLKPTEFNQLGGLSHMSCSS